MTLAEIESAIEKLPAPQLDELSEPFIVVIADLHEFLIRHLRQIKRLQRLGSLRLQPVNASALLVPVVAGVDVREPRVVPVGDVDRAVGADFDVDRAEPVVGRDGEQR